MKGCSGAGEQQRVTAKVFSDMEGSARLRRWNDRLCNMSCHLTSESSICLGIHRYISYDVYPRANTHV